MATMWLAELQSVWLFPTDPTHSQLLIHTDFTNHGGCLSGGKRSALPAVMLEPQGRCFVKCQVSAEMWFLHFLCLAVGVSYLKSLEH